MADPRAGFTRKAGERIKRAVEAVEADRFGAVARPENVQPSATYLPGRLAVLTEAIRGGIWNGTELESFSGEGYWLQPLAENIDTIAAQITDTFWNKVPGGEELPAGAVVQSAWIGGKNVINVAPCVVAVVPPSTPTSAGNGQNSSLLMRRVEQFQSDRQQMAVNSTLYLGGAPPAETIPAVPPLAQGLGSGLDGMQRVDAMAALNSLVLQVIVGQAGGTPPPAQTIPAVPPLAQGLGSGLDGMQRVSSLAGIQAAIAMINAGNAGGTPPSVETIPAVPPLGHGLSPGLDGMQRVEGLAGLQRLITQINAGLAGGTPPVAPVLPAEVPVWAAAAPVAPANNRVVSTRALRLAQHKIASLAGVPASTPTLATTEIRVRLTRCDGSTPYTNATVYLVSGVTTISSATTDSNGRCNLLVFGSGTYYLQYYHLTWFGALSGNTFTVADHPVSVHAQVDSLEFPDWCGGYDGPREYIDVNGMRDWNFADNMVPAKRRRMVARGAHVNLPASATMGPVDPPAPPPP